VLRADAPALVFAPMDGVTDAVMRALQGEVGAYSYSVTEFIRVNGDVLPPKVFRREVPELNQEAKTQTGLPVQVQLLGGHPDRMAQTAVNACRAGATSIDINFGCPAPTVNRNDGGASLLRYPSRIRDIVQAVRKAVPTHIPVSAKLRLGWESIDEIHENATMAAEGGASWLTIHARTRMQSYRPPVYWPHIGAVRKRLNLPIIANGDIWNLDDFRKCQDESGCRHFMIGRSGLANPELPRLIALELGLPIPTSRDLSWLHLFQRYLHYSDLFGEANTRRPLFRIKQWMKMASLYGDFPHFDFLKQTQSLEEIFDYLENCGPSAVLT
jgi:tRNA-dihydrouridine synthase C